jgi:hypothetical protein
MGRKAQIRPAGCLTRRRGSALPVDLRRTGCFDARKVGRYSMSAGAASDALEARGLEGLGEGHGWQEGSAPASQH